MAKKKGRNRNSSLNRRNSSGRNLQVTGADTPPEPPQDEYRAGEETESLALAAEADAHRPAEPVVAATTEDSSAQDTQPTPTPLTPVESEPYTHPLVAAMDSFTIDMTKLEAEPAAPAVSPPVSPRNDGQLGGYPPDCGTKEHKYLSYAKVLHDRGQTHPMSYSTTVMDALGHPMPEHYPLNTDFGAHSFHRLPTDSVVLSQYGIGMTLYFKFLKVMAWLFLILVVVSMPMLLIYIVGGAGSMAEFKALAKQNFPQILGMTSIGHLKASSSACDQVTSGNILSLTCPAGEIGFVKAVYSAHEAQGTCSCPEKNKVAAGSGLCRGKAVKTCASKNNCTNVCPSDGFGCFLGEHPISQWSCCAMTQDPVTHDPDFDDMRIQSTPGCGSDSIQAIVSGLCLGEKSCSFNVSEELKYRWTVDANLKTYCANDTTPGASCESAINDDADYSKCGDSPRGLIVFARCFTTRIDLSEEWSLKIIGWDSISRKNFLGLAVGCDIACSLFFFFIVLWLRKKEKKAVARMAKRQIKALDYTVQLMRLPHHIDLDELREEIRTHLEELLTASPMFAVDLDRIVIADIQFGKTTSGHLELLRNRGVIVRKLDVALQRYEKMKLLKGRIDDRKFAEREKQHLRNIRKLERELQKHTKRLDKWNVHQTRKGSAKAVTAFITFEEEEGYNRCLQEYPDFGMLYRLFQPYRKRLRGKRLRFRPAPDPTDIVWENLHHPYIERVLRQLIVALITLAVLFASFVLILVAMQEKTKLEREFGRPTTCPVVVTKDDVVQDELAKISGLTPYKALVECYCENILLSHSFTAMTEEEFYNPTTNQTVFYCKSWATSFLKTQGLSTLSVLMVVLVNELLARILKVLVGMEKHHTHSAQVVSTVKKVFLSQFFNTAILLVVINANTQYFTEDGTLASHGVLEVLSGKYSDFSPEWYNDVGVQLTLTMIINTFSPHASIIIEYLTLEFKRFADRGFSFDYTITKQDTQRDLEALYRGPRFDLASRYAQSLTCIFITYLFSAGIPLMHVVGFLAMLTTFWADKFMFLRITRSPPLYDGKVANAAGSMLPYAVLMHCLIAMWMYSNEMIFQSASDVSSELQVSTNQIGEGIPSFTPSRGDLLSRVTRPVVVILFGFFVAFGAIVVLRIILFQYFPSFVQSLCPVIKRLIEKPKMAKGIPNYFEAIPTPILKEKVMAPRIRESLREKYQQVLDKRTSSGTLDSPRRRKRALSAAEHFNQQNWIVGCVSYAISDNKEYVDELAIDSHLSQEINLEQIF